MKYILLTLMLSSLAVAGTVNIQKVEKYIENNDCKRVVISESKKVMVYRVCSDTYIIKYDDFKNITSALRYNEKGDETTFNVQ